MGATTEFCHGAQVLFLPLGQPVKSHSEKPFVKIGFNALTRRRYISNGDSDSLCIIPGMFPPFLQKIWMPLGNIHECL